MANSKSVQQLIEEEGQPTEEEDDEEQCFVSLDKLMEGGINASDIQKLKEGGISTCGMIRKSHLNTLLLLFCSELLAFDFIMHATFAQTQLKLHVRTFWRLKGLPTPRLRKFTQRLASCLAAYISYQANSASTTTKACLKSQRAVKLSMIF